MTHREETTMEIGQEPQKSVAIDLLRSASRKEMPIREAVLRLMPAGKAIYLLPVALFFFSLFFGRYMMDPVETFRILIIGSANACFGGAS
ncbi:MAG: iron ABC transporter permease, partial [Methanoculleus horonobensis]|nr:iron ABC transporter permease [Methanoculleus horonobensis]